jgi:hypothetical protein
MFAAVNLAEIGILILVSLSFKKTDSIIRKGRKIRSTWFESLQKFQSFKRYNR